jgi:hypothetical protein
MTATAQDAARRHFAMAHSGERLQETREHELEFKRHRETPHLLVKLLATFSTVHGWRRGGSSAAAELGFPVAVAQGTGR